MRFDIWIKILQEKENIKKTIEIISCKESLKEISQN